MPPIATPSVLGVDDWAMRKRHAYGTMPVDLERHRPVTLLPDREADTLAAWLHAHPGVAVISRDRSGAYAEGARRGAPEAVQVADRFHLLQNLAETLELVFTTYARDLRAVEQARHRTVTAEGGPVQVAPLARPTRTLALAAERRARRLARHGQVWALHHQGWPGEEIARHLGVGRATVFRDLRTEVFAERKDRGNTGRSLLDPQQDIVLEHWTAGRRDGHRLFLEPRRRGFRGSYQTVVRYLRRLREAHGAVQAYRPRRQPGPALAVAPRQRVLTPRTAAWTVLRRPDKRGRKEQALLDDARRHVPELDEAVALAEAFTGLVRDRAPERLDPWLQRAQDGAVTALRRFAKRLSADYDAVRAAVTLAQSNGPVEGQVNRLKAIKRAMYGRASLDLLERRFLLAA